MNKQEQLHQVLTNLSVEVPDVHGALLASRDGLPIVSTLNASEAGRAAAMAATVVALATRVIDTIGLGSFQETVIQGEAGVFVVYDAGSLAVLAVLAHRTATLGLVHLEARRAAEAIERLLITYREELRSQPAPPTAPATSTMPPAPTSAAPATHGTHGTPMPAPATPMPAMSTSPTSAAPSAPPAPSTPAAPTVTPMSPVAAPTSALRPPVAPARDADTPTDEPAGASADDEAPARPFAEPAFERAAV